MWGTHGVRVSQMWATRALPAGLCLALEVERDGGADEGLQSGLIHLLAFVDVDGAADVAFEAGVEEAGGVRQRRALGEGQFDDALVGLSGADDAAAGEDGRTRRRGFDPLPLFDNLRVGGEDDLADVCEGLAAPIAEVFDLRVDLCGGRFCRDSVFHGRLQRSPLFSLHEGFAATGIRTPPGIR